MYQFITGIAFELTLIVLFGIGLLTMHGIIPVKTSDDYRQWKQRNGRIITWICFMVIFLCVASIIGKYIQFSAGEAPGLKTG